MKKHTKDRPVLAAIVTTVAIVSTVVFAAPYPVGRCQRCGRDAEMHEVVYDEEPRFEGPMLVTSRGTAVLCERCWQSMSTVERLRIHRETLTRWEWPADQAAKVYATITGEVL